MAKKSKKIKKYLALIFSSILAIAFFALLFFLVWKSSLVPERQIYVSSKTPKQGDTVLIRVNSKYPAVTGSFGEKNLVFFKNGKYSDWDALLGIDADITPGKYKISVDVLGEKMEKEINVEAKNFPVIKMPVTKELQDKGYTGEKIIQNIKNNDNPVLNEILDKFTPQAYFNSPFSFPLHNIENSGLVFGHLIKGANYQIQHFGADLRATPGTEVYAVNSGKVVLTKDMANYGKTIVIDHGLGIFSLYLHLDEYKTSENEFVKNGQVIGLSGNSGYSTAPHLHFSIRNNKARVDPVSFIKITQEANDNFNLADITRAFLEIIGK